MKTYSLELAFMDDKKSHLPHPPIAEMQLKTYTRRTEDGPPIITPECVNISELDYQIDRLKAELDAIRASASAKSSAEAKRYQHVHSTQ